MRSGRGAPGVAAREVDRPRGGAVSLAVSPLVIDVLLADDHAVLRDALKFLLEEQPDIRVLASVGDGNEAVRLATQLAPCVAVLDLGMPARGGIDAARAIHRAAPRTGILMLSMHDSPELVRQAVSAGASGYVLKGSGGAELVKAVRAVAAGRRFFGSGIAAARTGKQRSHRASAGPLASLTAREREIVRLVADGYTNAQAASELGLSPRSVETYRGRVMHKLGLGSTAELVRFAIRHGLTAGD